MDQRRSITLVARPMIVLLAAVMFLQSTLFAHKVETSLWVERRNKRIAASFPKLSAPAASITSPYYVALQHGRMDDRHFGAGRHIYLLQDIHLNEEAQRHLAAALQNLIDQKKIDFVAVEGAFENFDFTPYRGLADKEMARALADYFLTQNMIGAPSYVGITSLALPPPFVGVDHLRLYDANVNAYLSARQRQSELSRRLGILEQNLKLRKISNYGPQLGALDAAMVRYEKGIDSLSAYLQSLRQLAMRDVFQAPEIARFMRAAAWESSAVISSVEHERAEALRFIAGRATPRELGALSAPAELSSLLRKYEFPAPRWRGLAAYLAYLEDIERLNIEKLNEEVAALVETLARDLSTTSVELALFEESRVVGLLRRLSRFEMTPVDWTAYQKASLPAGIETDFLKPFDQFYSAAHARSLAMVDQIDRLNGSGAFLVGGFHTPDITAELKRRGYAYSVITPRLTQLSDSGGAHYLSIFAREKTPLAWMFENRQLSILPRVTMLATRFGLGGLFISLYEALSAFKAKGRAAAVNLQGFGFAVGEEIPFGYLASKPSLIGGIKVQRIASWMQYAWLKTQPYHRLGAAVAVSLAGGIYLGGLRGIGMSLFGVTYSIVDFVKDRQEQPVREFKAESEMDLFEIYRILRLKIPRYTPGAVNYLSIDVRSFLEVLNQIHERSNGHPFNWEVLRRADWTEETIRQVERDVRIFRHAKMSQEMVKEGLGHQMNLNLWVTQLIKKFPTIRNHFNYGHFGAVGVWAKVGVNDKFRIGIYEGLIILAGMAGLSLWPVLVYPVWSAVQIAVMGVFFIHLFTGSLKVDNQVERGLLPAISSTIIASLSIAGALPALISLQSLKLGTALPLWGHVLMWAAAVLLATLPHAFANRGIERRLLDPSGPLNKVEDRWFNGLLRFKFSRFYFFAFLMFQLFIMLRVPVAGADYAWTMGVIEPHENNGITLFEATPRYVGRALRHGRFYTVSSDPIHKLHPSLIEPLGELNYLERLLVGSHAGMEFVRKVNDSWHVHHVVEGMSAEEEAAIRDIIAEIERTDGFTERHQQAILETTGGEHKTFKYRPFGKEKSMVQRTRVNELLNQYLQERGLARFEATLAGGTSIHIMPSSKETGMRRMSRLYLRAFEYFVFFGDSLYPGGNDADAAKVALMNVHVGKNENKNTQMKLPARHDVVYADKMAVDGAVEPYVDMINFTRRLARLLWWLPPEPTHFDPPDHGPGSPHFDGGSSLTDSSIDVLDEIGQTNSQIRMQGVRQFGAQVQNRVRRLISLRGTTVGAVAAEINAAVDVAQRSAHNTQVEFLISPANEHLLPQLLSRTGYDRLAFHRVSLLTTPQAIQFMLEAPGQKDLFTQIEFVLFRQEGLPRPFLESLFALAHSDSAWSDLIAMTFFNVSILEDRGESFFLRNLDRFEQLVDQFA